MTGTLHIPATSTASSLSVDMTGTWASGGSTLNFTQGPIASSQHDLPAQEGRLRALIERFRSDLGAPDLPFIIGQLGRFEKGPWSAAKERVNAAQRSIAGQMHNVAYVSSDRVADRGDTTHFDSPSAR